MGEDCCCCSSFLIVVAALLIIYKFVVPESWRSIFYGFLKLVRMLISVKIHSLRYAGKYYSFIDEVERNAKKNPNALQFLVVEDGREVTISELNQQANQVSHWAQSVGYKPRDTVALMMFNRPELVAFWVGLGKIAASTALINTNVTGKALLHTVEVATQASEIKIFVVDSELRESIADDMASIEALGIQIIFWDDLAPQIAKFPKDKPKVNLRNILLESDTLVYIYTSGTTGMPKASKISHSKFLLATIPFTHLCQLGTKSRIYNCLPLYHSAGGMLGVGSALKSGACMVLRKKFSARSFAADCTKYNCNVVQYIGELCRYLTTSAPTEEEQKLKIDYAFGNGMRPDVWEKFQARFHIKHVVEIYASTEGNFALFNSCDRVGALGFVPRIFDWLYPVKLVKMDPDHKDVPLRDSKGFCIASAPGEVGLMIGEIDNKRVDRRFDGYSDKEATKKKIISNAFRKGDTFFNTGDLLSRDQLGFFYWSDRTGDTYRWKGENVATTEVANVVASVPGLQDEAVYGVEVPNCDGRAGMVAITLAKGITAETFPWDKMHAELSANLPAYARPLFFRLQQHMAMTATFKHQKNDLVKEGFNPETTKGDAIFFYNIKQGTFTPMTADLYTKICNQQVQV